VQKIKSLFKYCLSDRKGQIFQSDKAYFAGVAGSYDEKIQRSMTGKAAFEGRIIIFKQALNRFGYFFIGYLQRSLAQAFSHGSVNYQ
jgi:hypothetical protein